MTKEDILELIKEAKLLDLKSISIGDIKVEFNNGTQRDKLSVNTETPDELTAEEIVAPQSPYENLTDQEILFWSTGYGVELEQEKHVEEKRKQEIKEGDQLR